MYVHTIFYKTSQFILTIIKLPSFQPSIGMSNGLLRFLNLVAYFAINETTFAIKFLSYFHRIKTFHPTHLIP